MKKAFTRVLFSLIVLMGVHTKSSFAQSSAWQWARSAGSTGSEAAMGSALDATGNLYVVGWYTSANITFGSVTLTNPGSFTSDMFLVKYNSSGTVLWAKTFGSVDGDNGNGIAVDATGNVYVTGWYTGATLVMDSYTLTNSTTGNSDIFIAKIDPSGTTVWAKTAGGSSTDRGLGITIDPSGNVFTAGAFSSPAINFGTGSLSNSSINTNDIFLVKHDPNGNALWSKGAIGTGADIANSVSTDSLGNVYVTGTFASTAINFGTPIMFNAGASTQDLFVTKFSSLGTPVWSVRSGGSLDDFGNSISVRKGGVYVTGGFSSAMAAFGTTTLTNVSAGTSDFLLVKFDLSGNPQWAKRSGGIDFEAGNAVAVDSLENIYVSGYFSSGSTTFGTSTLTNAMGGYRDLFIAGYDLGGNSLWATTAQGGTYDETGNCISVNSTGTDIYIGGTFNSPSVNFGTGTIFKGCGDDVFVAKLLGSLVGITEIQAESETKIYPNPSNGKFTVEAEGTIIFYNVLGEEIFSKELNRIERNEVDLSSYSKGFYSFRVIFANKKQQSGRIIIE